MTDHVSPERSGDGSTRRRFLKRLGQGAVAGGMVAPLLDDSHAAAEQTTPGKVRHRILGKTGLKVSEVAFGGHSWAYKRVPDGAGGYRRTTVEEAVEMIAAGMDMGINFLDSCTAHEESLTPGEALKRLKRRDEMLIAVRVSHMMNGNENDKQEVYTWVEDRLKMWQTDRIDICMLCNTANDTPRSGYWDMTYSMEALDKLKKQGKIRYTGFGCHFTPEWFTTAFEKFGDYFDVCSLPYNVRHRVAEEIMPQAKQKKMGVITIKPFARGSLLKGRDLEDKDAGLPRDMMAFVLENEHVDICTCGVHTLAQVKENFSSSWTKISPTGRERLKELAAVELPHGEHAWLEEGWRYA